MKVGVLEPNGKWSKRESWFLWHHGTIATGGCIQKHASPATISIFELVSSVPVSEFSRQVSWGGLCLAHSWLRLTSRSSLTQIVSLIFIWYGSRSRIKLDSLAHEISGKCAASSWDQQGNKTQKVLSKPDRHSSLQTSEHWPLCDKPDFPHCPSRPLRDTPFLPMHCISNQKGKDIYNHGTKIPHELDNSHKYKHACLGVSISRR